jgi:hypothetical protein
MLINNVNAEYVNTPERFKSQRKVNDKIEKFLLEQALEIEKKIKVKSNDK